MARILSILVGLFFTVALLWSFGNGFYTWAIDPAAETAEEVFHKHPEAHHFSFDGPFGTFDHQQLQRGFQVYQQVCAACHALKHVAFRDLAQLGYNDAEVKAIAAQFQVPKYDAATGEVTTNPGAPTDYFPPVAYAGQGSPPDLSLVVKARHGGAQYVRSLLTGYTDQPAALLKEFPDSKTPDGLYYNPYFANLNLAMPPPLVDDAVTYSDGTPATTAQEATDVAAFLAWAAEPTMDKRKQTGWPILGFLLFATILGYMSYRNIWANKKH
ncbi:cytochrome c1 [Novosphingobium sp. 1949]|uniref:Cytochrome c1 n=1 Tax=Novosphingobium organovorum TaxID=2930092 RepID=A0ABT0B9F2_9SPHN|nr:cytochrome c1 [Novosphingobium organovorum]MCJ2181500.1 cytochrome c1 [Novosphingobium organovorum]